MSPSQFRIRWKRDLDHAEATLLREGSVAPLFAVVAADGKNAVLAADFSDDEAKRRSLEVVRLAAMAADARAVFMRMESWLVLGDPLPEGLSPSRSDRRVEVLMVAALARSGEGLEKRFSLREIVRGEDGLPVSLRELSSPDDALARGPMFDLLPPRPPSALERAYAAAVLERMGSATGH